MALARRLDESDEAIPEQLEPYLEGGELQARSAESLRDPPR